MKDNTNAYFLARKEAAKYNDRLYSREGASELLGLSPAALADYELGNCKSVPVDKVVLMADLYNKPELKNRYCKEECPIGKHHCLATSERGLEGITLRLLRELDPDRIEDLSKDLVDIAEDGVISEDEQPRIKQILDSLDRLSVVISELKIVGIKALEGCDG